MFEKFKKQVSNYFAQADHRRLNSALVDLLQSMDLQAYDQTAFNDLVSNPLFKNNKDMLVKHTFELKYSNKIGLEKVTLNHGSLLHCAALTANLNLLDKLVDLGLDVTKVDFDGKKAADYLVFPPHTSLQEKESYWQMLGKKSSSTMKFS